MQHLPRATGHSNYNLRRLVRLWLNMFVNFSVMPLRLATVAGFAISLGGLIGPLWVVIDALVNKTPQGWASLSVAVLLLSGVQLMMLGLIGEYLGRLYFTANGKPQSTVKDVTRNGAAEPLLRQPDDRLGTLVMRHG